MTALQLEEFLKRHNMEPNQFAELIGLTPSAVNHWLLGIRTIAKPYGRLIRLFDKHPKLMSDFK